MRDASVSLIVFNFFLACSFQTHVLCYRRRSSSHRYTFLILFSFAMWLHKMQKNPHIDFYVPIETCEFVQEEKIPCEFSLKYADRLIYVRCQLPLTTTNNIGFEFIILDGEYAYA